MRCRGSVIILVLLTVLLAGFLLSNFLQRANTELLADARAAQQAKLRREAYSALEVIRAVLADAQLLTAPGADSTRDWMHPLDYAGYAPPGVKLEVALEDETARISLPHCDADTLVTLFVELGTDRMQAERATDALLSWTRPVDASAQPRYESDEPPHRTAQRPLRSFEELASIAVVRELLFDETGQPNEKYARFSEAVSLHAFPETNLNTASPSVRTALRQGPRSATTNANQPTPPPGLLRVNITTMTGGISYRMTVVLSTVATSSSQSILEIREDLPDTLPAS